MDQATYDMWAWIFGIIAVLCILVWCWADIYYDRMKSIPFWIHSLGIVGLAFLIITGAMLWQVLTQPIPAWGLFP